MPKGKQCQEWCVQVFWEDDKVVSDSIRYLRRDVVERTVRDAFTTTWKPQVKLVMKLDSDTYEVEETVEELEEQALSVVSDLLQDNDGLIDLFSEITTRIMGGYKPSEDTEGDPRYDHWYSTYSNMQNRIMSRFMYQQYFPYAPTPKGG